MKKSIYSIASRARGLSMSIFKLITERDLYALVATEVCWKSFKI